MHMPGNRTVAGVGLTLLVAVSAATASPSSTEATAQSATVQPETLSPQQSKPHPKPRLLACSLMVNEVPYVLEWIEFHRLMGFHRIIIYDDYSSDNATMLNNLYQQHHRSYLTIEPGIWDDDQRMRRIKSAADCFNKYINQSDWLIHLDIDEFIWSPAYLDLPTYFLTEVPEETHIIYAGATRFGFNGQRFRHSYFLHQASSSHAPLKAHQRQLHILLTLSNSCAAFATKNSFHTFFPYIWGHEEVSTS